jgi:hypothetical protein
VFLLSLHTRQATSGHRNQHPHGDHFAIDSNGAVVSFPALVDNRLGTKRFSLPPAPAFQGTYGAAYAPCLKWWFGLGTCATRVPATKLNKKPEKTSNVDDLPGVITNSAKDGR